MKMKLEIAGGLSVLALSGAGVNDAIVLDEEPIALIQIVADERVEVKQTENVVETTLPWKDQKGFKVVVDLGEPTISERIADKRKREVILEPVTFNSEDSQPSGFKIDIILNERPDTNVFCQQIEGAENYDFFYQAALTTEETDQGDIRPDNVVGSYSVYHKYLRDYKGKEENYATGKVMQIYRPQVWEVNNEKNTKEWAELSYSEGKLCVWVRQEFLDNAVYPVRVDPTFGYTTAGASATGADNLQLASKAILRENAVITDLSAWIGTTAPTSTKMAIYAYVTDTNAGELIASTAEFIPTLTGGATIQALNTQSITSFTTGYNTYFLAIYSGDSTTSVNVGFDTTTNAYIQDTNTYPTWSDPFAESFTANTRIFSIYATYNSIPPTSIINVTDGGINIRSGTLIVR